jgi:hypothetical protein
MGLGPATVVRLERALAHEVSPLLHSHTWICAEGGAGYKIERCRHGHAGKAAVGIQKRPSTQASSHGTGVGRAGSNSSASSEPPPPNTSKTAYGEPVRSAMSGDTPGNKDFSEN